MASNTDQGAQTQKELYTSLCYITCTETSTVKFRVSSALNQAFCFLVSANLSLCLLHITIPQLWDYLVLSSVSLFQALILSCFACIPFSLLLLYHILFNTLSFISSYYCRGFRYNIILMNNIYCYGIATVEVKLSKRTNCGSSEDHSVKSIGNFIWSVEFTTQKRSRGTEF